MAFGPMGKPPTWRGWPRCRYCQMVAGANCDGCKWCAKLWETVIAQLLKDCC